MKPFFRRKYIYETDVDELKLLSLRSRDHIQGFNEINEIRIAYWFRDHLGKTRFGFLKRAYKLKRIPDHLTHLIDSPRGSMTTK